MSLLSKVTTGKQALPPRLTVYGSEGVGKSTLGNNAPSPIFIDAEGGLGEIDCARFPLAKTSDEVFAALAELRSADHPYRTIIVDTADAVERLFHADVCKRYGVNSIEKSAGGFGKGYVESAMLFERMFGALDALRLEKGMVVIIVAHAKVEKYYDPEAGEFDRYSPRLHKTACAILKEWSDAVLFATRRMRIERDGDRTQAKPIGAGAGERIIKTEGGPACVAKNRYNMPIEIPLAWDAVCEAITKSQAPVAP
ncbi:MAG: ATP-binding protein, partial [Planctomycetes bacterium]|nr:ATP-binding protein [Planctomycetota bacterium]